MGIIRHNPYRDNKLTCLDMEIAVAEHFGWRQNLIVPNVWWGLGLSHEADLLIVRNSGYATEVEIKISVQDLKADLKKKHNHESNKIKHLYFAVPVKMREIANQLIPEKAGLLAVEQWSDDYYKVWIDRLPLANQPCERLSREDITKLFELASMRIWTLKKHLRKKCRNLVKVAGVHKQRGGGR